MKTLQTNKGFTLIEVVIVMVIFSVIITMATIKMGNPRIKQMRQSSERVATLIQLAQEQAIFNSQDYALSVWQSGYAFYTLYEEAWIPVNNDHTFRPRSLPDDLEFYLYLDDLKVILEREDNKKPQIFITSDGEISPFKLEISDQYDLLYEITFNETGKFEITLADV